MNFGEVIKELRAGTKRAQRQGWNGKSMYIYIEQGKVIPHKVLRDPIATWLKKQDMDVEPHFNMFTADKKIVSGWLASQTDMLARDWRILKDDE